MHYWNLFIESYKGYANYFWNEITHPSFHNYFYWLIGGSLIFFLFEVIVPWRKKQPIPRKDFWLDTFYMFFNFFLFSLIIYNAASTVVVDFFQNIVKSTLNFDLAASNPMKNWPYWAILLTGMFLRDFIQWWVHRLLHRVEFLWQFHKVHHSVEQMGFAAQLRYHWMENIVYRSLEYLPLALLGYGLYDYFIIHIFAFLWGHFNHANITVDGRISGGVIGLLLGLVLANSLLDVHVFDGISILGNIGVTLGFTALGSLVLGPFMRILFNSPEMHIWHHAYTLPEDRRYGVNFGLTLAIWDYIFGTNYIPSDGRDIRLGFPGVEEFPNDFVGQNMYGLKQPTEEKSN